MGKRAQGFVFDAPQLNSDKKMKGLRRNDAAQ
jgi:hypothetical protein